MLTMAFWIHWIGKRGEQREDDIAVVNSAAYHDREHVLETRRGSFEKGF